MRRGEEEFKNWLDKKGYPYFYIEQSPETFSSFFKGLSKRPDFLVVIQHFGIIAVDVKERNNKYQNFTLDEDSDIKKYLEFERITRLPVWFVFCRPEEYKVWYWIPLSRVLECELKNGKDGNFRVIKPSDCIILQDKDNISRLIDNEIS